MTGRFSRRAGGVGSAAVLLFAFPGGGRGASRPAGGRARERRRREPLRLDGLAPQPFGLAARGRPRARRGDGAGRDGAPRPRSPRQTRRVDDPVASLFGLDSAAGCLTATGRPAIPPPGRHRQRRGSAGDLRPRPPGPPRGRGPEAGRDGDRSVAHAHGRGRNRLPDERGRGPPRAGDRGARDDPRRHRPRERREAPRGGRRALLAAAGDRARRRRRDPARTGRGARPRAARRWRTPPSSTT